MSVPAVDPYRQSLRRSRERRAQASKRRRWQLRKRSVSLVLAAVMVLGGGAALAAGGGSEAGTTAAGVGTLKKGSSGEAVAAVQRKLGITADGSFGPLTTRAVRRFQRRNGLMVDGVVGPQTLAALGLGGLKVAPEEEPAGGNQQKRGGASGHLEKIAQCESGGDPNAIGGGGEFRGKYQFTRASWRTVGGKGDPARASEAEQDKRAKMLYRRQGPSAWPNCA
jgi:hypothetical protein